MVSHDDPAVWLTFSATEREEESARILRSLEFLRGYGSAGEALLRDAEQLFAQIRSEGRCREDAYLSLSERIIERVAAEPRPPAAARGVLDLSRVHFQVGEAIDRHHLADVVAAVAAAAPDDSTEANRSLIGDLFYHHHLWAAHRQRKAGGWASFVQYLRGEPALWRGSGVYALRSIVSDAVHTAVRQDDAATVQLLSRELSGDPGVEKLLNRRLAEGKEEPRG